MDDKISTEVQYMDKKISESVSKIITEIENGEKLKINDEKNKSDDSGSTNNGNQKSSDESSKSEEGKSEEGNSGGDKESSGESNSNGEKSNSEGSSNESKSSEKGNKSSNEESSDDEVKDMSVKYTENSGGSNIDWDDIRENTQELYTSWNVIESDLLTKQNLNRTDLTDIKNIMDSLLSDSTNEKKENYIMSSASFYKSLYAILDKINYDKNKRDLLEIKQHVYEVYYYALMDDWDNVKLGLENANSKIQSLNNVEDQTKIAYSNLVSSVNTNNRAVLFIKCSDALERLENINFYK